jgi:hypothetical protein
MSEKPQAKSKARPRPSERKSASGEQADVPTPLRKYYLAAALFFFIGDILAISTSAFVSTIVFTVLTLMMLWIAWRVDRFLENRRPRGTPSSRDRTY